MRPMSSLMAPQAQATSHVTAALLAVLQQGCAWNVPLNAVEGLWQRGSRAFRMANRRSEALGSGAAWHRAHRSYAASAATLMYQHLQPLFMASTVVAAVPWLW
jgi:hypothetical protein